MEGPKRTAPALLPPRSDVVHVPHLGSPRGRVVDSAAGGREAVLDVAGRGVARGENVGRCADQSGGEEDDAWPEGPGHY